MEEVMAGESAKTKMDLIKNIGVDEALRVCGRRKCEFLRVGWRGWNGCW